MSKYIPLCSYISETDSTDKISFFYRSVADTYPLHSHDFYEMELVTAGRGHQWINNECVALLPGSLYLCTPSDIHRIEADEPLQIISVHFLPEIAKQMNLSQKLDAYTTELDSQMLSFFSHLADSVLSEKKQKLPYQEQKLLSVTMLMLVHLLREGTRLYFPAAGQHVQVALKYIAENYTDPQLRMNEVAQISSLSACHFSTLFNSIVGCSFPEYLTSYRLRRAIILLAESELSITEIAYEVGFSTLSHFFRCFRDIYGCTPKQYRRKLPGTEQALSALDQLRWSSPLVSAPEKD